MRARLTIPLTARDHVLGPADAPVTLIEYGDFECPYCAAAHVIIKKVLEIMSDQLRFAFRHFPLTQIHPHAESAAEASEAAGAQGQFWEMHDLLFENQPMLDPPHLVAYAQELGLDLKRFVRELEEGVYRQRVREDFLGGVRSGVNGTPAFFINGDRYDGSWDIAPLITALERAASVAEVR
ncbi:MAG TPA: thioredoxin domain-containing protein [Pyrinomonadaceae bacterium]|nr:thioredoxin domain-containing protein [Pyrinomonadaceae bacterium]